MAISLYDLSVRTFLQIVRAVGGVLDRAAVHCADTGLDPDDFVEARPKAFHVAREGAKSRRSLAGAGPCAFSKRAQAG